MSPRNGRRGWRNNPIAYFLQTGVYVGIDEVMKSMKRILSILILTLGATLLAGCLAPGVMGGKKKPINEVEKGLIADAIPRLEGTRSSLSKTWILLGVYPIEDYLVEKECMRSGDSLTCLFKFRGDYKIMITWDKNRTIKRIVAGEVGDWSEFETAPLAKDG